MSHPGPSTSSIAARLPRVLAPPAMLAAGVLLVACGGSGSPSSATASEGAKEQRNEAKLADFAKCLREHGVHAETGNGPGGGAALKVSPGSAGAGPVAFEAAQKACARYRPAAKHVNLSPQQKVEMEERLQKFAKCMREHGIKVEVSTQGGGVQIGIHRGNVGGPNPESPGFQEAQNACQSLLPKPPGARKGGPFTSKGAEVGALPAGG
jgi:hypothetical protein